MESNINILIIGVTGNGKSTLGNFILQQQVFQSGLGMIAVTSEAKKETRKIQGVDLTIIDTVGFSDDLGPLENHLDQICHALDVCKGGIDAVIFAIKSTERFTTSISTVLTEMYQISDLWDHCFVAFTSAKGLGNTESEQVHKILSNLAHPRCPESLKTLLNKVQQRYILVESKDDMGDNYHATKMGQLFQMVSNIKQCTPGPYTNRSFQLAFTKYKEAKEKERLKEIQQQEQQRILEQQRIQIQQQQRQLEEQRQRQQRENERRQQEIQRQLEEERRRNAQLQQQQRYYNSSRRSDDCTIL
ncbi:uncharacterized protein [Dysidea avara]|uniref:uncharacterized protein n=1 Tax=Dysidea avara TaxID=196820 RepID=UPI00331B5696